jgi:hypothetical protein
MCSRLRLTEGLAGCFSSTWRNGRGTSRLAPIRPERGRDFQSRPLSRGSRKGHPARSVHDHKASHEVSLRRLCVGRSTCATDRECNQLETLAVDDLAVLPERTRASVRIGHTHGAACRPEFPAVRQHFESQPGSIHRHVSRPLRHVGELILGQIGATTSFSVDEHDSLRADVAAVMLERLERPSAPFRRGSCGRLPGVLPSEVWV